MLDDIGAQGLVMDVWLEAACEENVTFESILAHMERFTIRQMKEEPMHTEAGKRFWAEKQKIALDLIKSAVDILSDSGIENKAKIRVNLNRYLNHPKTLCDFSLQSFAERMLTL